MEMLPHFMPQKGIATECPLMWLGVEQLTDEEGLSFFHGLTLELSGCRRDANDLSASATPAGLAISAPPHWLGQIGQTAEVRRRKDGCGFLLSCRPCELCDQRPPGLTRFWPSFLAFGVTHSASQNIRSVSLSSACTRKLEQLADETTRAQWTHRPELRLFYPRNMRLNGRRDRD